MAQIKPIDALTKLAPVQWRDYVTSLSPEESRAAQDELDTLITEAARLRAYMSTRQHDTHYGSVSASNKLVRKVRAMLGYSHPAQSEVNF